VDDGTDPLGADEPARDRRRLDPARLAGQLADMQANVVLMGMGGICAYYPTRVEFHYASPHLPAGRDMFGDFVREAHARRIRVVGRYDLSKPRSRSTTPARSGSSARPTVRP